MWRSEGIIGQVTNLKPNTKRPRDQEVVPNKDGRITVVNDSKELGIENGENWLRRE